MTRSTIALVGGGARSGKSDFALALARTRGARRAFVATGQASDDEMRARVAAHVRTRGPDFRTVEEPVELAACLRELRDVEVAVVDCLTLWLSNLMLRDESLATIAARVDELAGVLHDRPFATILVTNEVGMGVVPPSALGRAFRDAVGAAHQRLAEVADEIYLVILGSVLRIRPAPVAIPTLESLP
jgi:adenosylcobinamide kinase/adenosylcobinamide-phosphate guanylyltransferase